MEENKNIINVTEEEKKLLILKDKVELMINKTSKPSSYEFGKAGNRFKLYFDDAKDLNEQINELKNLGLYKEEF